MGLTTAVSSRAVDVRICEAHFDGSQFESNRADGRKMLKPTAVPNLLPHLMSVKRDTEHHTGSSSTSPRGTAAGHSSWTAPTLLSPQVRHIDLQNVLVSGAREHTQDHVSVDSEAASLHVPSVSSEQHTCQGELLPLSADMLGTVWSSAYHPCHEMGLISVTKDHAYARILSGKGDQAVRSVARPSDTATQGVSQQGPSSSYEVQVPTDTVATPTEWPPSCSNLDDGPSEFPLGAPGNSEAAFRSMEVQVPTETVATPTEWPPSCSNALTSQESAPSLSQERFSVGSNPFTPEERVKLLRRVAHLEKLTRQSRRRCRTLSLSKKRLEKGLQGVFRKDQLAALSRSSNRGCKWSQATVKTGLQLHFSCGTSGYETILNQKLPFPSARTLRRRVQGIKFQPGILHEVFQLLQAKVPGLNEQERCCLLMIDEMSIQQRIEYDSSTSSVRGYTTLPVPGADCNVPASHGLVFMVCGISTRWKQVVAYHYTGASFSGIDAGNFTASVIEKCFDIGLKVLAITTDMAPGNRSMWQYFGVVTGKHSRVANVAKHPSFGNHIIRVLADVPHLVKNLCSHIVSGQQIIIDPVDVAKHGLVGNTVSIEPIKRLVQHQVGSTFKLAPNLKPELLDPNHFDKMKVCNAMYIFSNSTATALRTMVKEHGWEETVLVTAWFLQQVNHWFDIICSRHPVMALSRHNPARHEEAVASLETFMDMFCRMKIGNGQFKPCQAGVRLSTTSILQLQQYLLEDLSFEFLLTSRFTQDSLENFFSTVRLKNPTPTPMEFKMALKIISISQYLKVATTGSYEVDDGTYFLADFDTSLVSNNLDVDIDVDNMTYGRPILTEVEESAFYYYAGYILSRVIKNNKVCSQCTNAVVAKPNEISRVQQFTLEKSYGVDSLTCPSAGAYELLLRCESSFRSNIKQYMDKDNIISTLSGKMSLASEDIDIPQCHGIKDNIIKRFCHARLQLHLSELSESMCVQRIDRSSMSMCAPRRQ